MIRILILASLIATPLFGQSDRTVLSAPKEVVAEYLHGIYIYDSYRWMEQEGDPRLQPWLESQEERTRRYLKSTLFNEFYKELDPLMFPSEADKALQGLDQRQVQMETRWQHKFAPEILESIDEDALLKSTNGQYQIQYMSDSGSDFKRLAIFDKTSKTYLKDTLYIAGGNSAWIDDDTIIYASRMRGKVFQSHYGVYVHKLGTAQAEDRQVIRASSPYEFLGVLPLKNRGVVSEVIVWEGSFASTILKRVRLSDGNAETIYASAGANLDVIDLDANRIVMISFKHSNFGEVVELNLQSGKTKTIVPETGKTLDSALLSSEYIYLSYISNGVNQLIQRDLATGKMREVSLPEQVGIILSKHEQEVQVKTHGYASTSAQWRINEKMAALEVVKEASPLEVPLDVKKLFYIAHNGMQVPMWVVVKKDQPLNENTPLILTGYGGFRISETPRFMPEIVPWLKRGGAVGYVVLPGGLELGESWHKAGSRFNKLNVFNDFATAARTLIKKGISSHERLGAYGASNGGLLVAATMNMYPNLFAAVVPDVGVLDMTRFELFTGGRLWTTEYGSRVHADEFSYMLKYSPYHQLKQRRYPSVLVITAEEDDRVVPYHSYKYAARLQTVQQADDPVLLHIRRNGSHSRYAGPKSTVLRGLATKYGFFAQELGL